MRVALYSSVAIILAVSPLQAKAEEISEAGARQITEKLTYYLPKSVFESGFLKVVPATKRYELSFDFAQLLKDMDPKSFSISGMKPIIQYLTPQDDGLWKVEGNNNINVSGFVTTKGDKADFTYMIEKMAFEGVFDPELTFMRSSTANLDKIKVNTHTGPAAFEMALESFTSEMRAENISNGVADFVSNLSGRGLTETITDANASPVNISIASMDGRSQADKLGVRALRDLVVFGLDKAKSESKTLTVEEDAKLKALLKANVPFVDNLAYDLHFRDVKVAAEGMEVSLADVGYKLDFNGIKPDTRIGVEFSIADPKVPAGLLPAGTEAALPKTASMGVGFTGLNVEGVVAYVLEHADFTKEEPLTAEQTKELDKILLPDGKMRIAFNNVSARSEVYDLSLAGTMMVNPNDSDKPEADITVTARDLDKTVNYLQANAAAVPQFGQASFMLLMMKGFGRQEADGSMTWNVKLDQAGKVMINGREMPH